MGVVRVLAIHWELMVSLGLLGFWRGMAGFLRFTEIPPFLFLLAMSWVKVLIEHYPRRRACGLLKCPISKHRTSDSAPSPSSHHLLSAPVSPPIPYVYRSLSSHSALRHSQKPSTRPISLLSF